MGFYCVGIGWNWFPLTDFTRPQQFCVWPDWIFLKLILIFVLFFICSQHVYSGNNPQAQEAMQLHQVTVSQTVSMTEVRCHINKSDGCYVNPKRGKHTVLPFIHTRPAKAQTAFLNRALCLPLVTVTALQTGSSATTVTATTASITWNMKRNVSKL